MNFHSVSLSNRATSDSIYCLALQASRWTWSDEIQRILSSSGSRILSVDLSDCVNDVQINSLLYCSDQDEIHATVWKSFIRVDVPLVRSSCSSVGATSFALTGSCLESTVCLGKLFSKSVQDLVADLSGCVSLGLDL